MFGFSGVGRRIVKQLINADEHVIVVDPHATRLEREDLRRWGVPYIEGSGQRSEILREAGIRDARAVICVHTDDLPNIEIALLIREFSPTVRIVIRTSNTAVAKALNAVAIPGAVLDVAQLASASFFEVAANRTTHPLTLGDEEFIVATVRSRSTGNLRSLWGNLAPVAVQPRDDSPTVICPSRNYVVGQGDLVTLIGTQTDYDDLGISLGESAITRPHVPLGRRIRDSFTAISEAVDRPFRIAFATLAILSVVSIAILTLGYHEPDGTHMDFLDAVYFTAETIGTVGFGDYYFRDQDTWLRLWAIFLILFGVFGVALATALLTNALVTRRLAQSLGRQRLTRIRDHIVVIGLGTVGSTVAMDLHNAGYAVAVIDRDENNRFVPQLRDASIPVLIGDATLPETLLSAGLPRAAGVAVLTSDDLVNIETALAIRDATADRRIPMALRFFERNLARVVGNTLDVGTTRSTAELASPWFVGAALGLEILGTFYIGQTPFMAARLTVRAGSQLDGLAMQDLAARTRVVAIERADGMQRLEHPPRSETLFRAGDRAYLVGLHEELLEVLQRA